MRLNIFKDYISDKAGNRAFISYFGSRKAARKALNSLKNCKNCIDCTNCTNCESCIDCKSCTNCKSCRNCRSCRSCRSCDLTKPHQFLPVSEPRPYTWLAIWEEGSWRIRAGCKSFNIEQARKHWLSSDYNGPASVKSTVGFALDWLLEQEVMDESG